MKTTIKKLSEEIEYQRTTTKVIFEVNGKKVEVLTYSSTDSQEIMDMCGDEYEINEKDSEALTDEEHEAFGLDLNEYLALEVGEEEVIDNEE